MAEPFTIYKLTLLYMLDRAGFPLSNTQITGFFLDLDYTDYFHVQQAISDLLDASLITEEVMPTNIQYSISPAGKDTLRYLSGKITDEIRTDVKNFFEKNGFRLRQENEIVARYVYTSNYNYLVTCQVRTDNDPVIDLHFSVKTEEQAKVICRNWQEKHDAIYGFLMDQLLT